MTSPAPGTHGLPGGPGTSTTTSARATPTNGVTQTQPARQSGVVTSSTGGAAGVRLPATFAIRAAGALSPPSVSAPSGIPIQLTMVSADGSAHQVVVAGHRLSVPSGGQASLLITGLRASRYPVAVDGHARGTLVVGGAPGP